MLRSLSPSLICPRNPELHSSPWIPHAQLFTSSTHLNPTNNMRSLLAALILLAAAADATPTRRANNRYYIQPKGRCDICMLAKGADVVMWVWRAARGEMSELISPATSAACARSLTRGSGGARTSPTRFSTAVAASASLSAEVGAARPVAVHTPHTHSLPERQLQGRERRQDLPRRLPPRHQQERRAAGHLGDLQQQHDPHLQNKYAPPPPLVLALGSANAARQTSAWTTRTALSRTPRSGNAPTATPTSSGASTR